MATPVKMPELGESITEGTITRWLKQEGDQVEADEPLFEVSTDKVDTEVPSPVAGVLKTIKVQADETVEVGAELAIIEQDGEAGGEDKSGGRGVEEADERHRRGGGRGRGGQRGGRLRGGAGVRGGPGRGGDEAGRGEPEAEEQPKPKAEASGDGGTTTVTMPELGESITEGTITRWLKQEGDQVEADEPLFEISTDKVDTEVPSPVAGVLQSIKVQADETVEVGAELAVIGGGGGGSAEAEKAEERPRSEAKEETAEEGAGAEAEQAAEDQEQAEAPSRARAGRPRPSRRSPRATGRGTARPRPGCRRWCGGWPASTTST